jgi:uncharacterized protein (DUF2336 family)
MSKILKRLFGLGKSLTYEQARELAADPDKQIRFQLARREDLQPEILYFLTEDETPEVRRCVAANPAAPPQADLKLASDRDEAVRRHIAGKVSKLVPGLSDDDNEKLRQLAYQTLDILARDQVANVRRILADTLKDVLDAPPSLIQRLARDAEIAVAAPVLQFSPVLTDEDLLDIITNSPIPGAVAAISRRAAVSFAVTDAICATDDVDGIAVLLENPSAQIREETLDNLVDRAVEIESWHKPLVKRPQMSARVARKLARFVAANLLRALADRNDLNPEAAAAVAEVVKKRIDEMGAVGPAKAEAKKAADEATATARARMLHKAGQLDETAIDTALSGGEYNFVVAAIAELAGMHMEVVKKAVSTQNAKGIVAVVWKAGLSMGLAVEIQTKVLHLSPHRVLHPRQGNFPLSPEDMTWQLEFLGG